MKDFLPAAMALGQGKVDIPAILAMMEGRKTAGLVMVELIRRCASRLRLSKTRRSRRRTWRNRASGSRLMGAEFRVVQDIECARVRGYESW